MPRRFFVRETSCPAPTVAIGSHSVDNGARLVEDGADPLAVISEVFGQRDIRAAAQRFDGLFGKA